MPGTTRSNRQEPSNAAMPQVDPEADAMTIHQLSERSGVPKRRIRHYIAEGLLPGAVGSGRAAHYRGEHLARLHQIEALREVNLGLDEIRRRLGVPAQPSESVAVGRADLWRRWELAPGIELQVRADLAPDIAALARVLVGVAHQLLGQGAGADEAADGSASHRSEREEKRG